MTELRAFPMQFLASKNGLIMFPWGSQRVSPSSELVPIMVPMGFLKGFSSLEFVPIMFPWGSQRVPQVPQYFSHY